MKQKTAFVILSWLSASALLLGQARAQNAGPFPPCVPAAPAQAQAGGARGPGAPAQAQPGQAGRGTAQVVPRGTVTAISGVVSAGGKWTKVWQAGGNSADGIIAD